MKKERKNLMPTLMGLIILIEGIVLTVFSRRVELIDVVVLDQLMVMLLGIGLVVIGLLLVLPILPVWKSELKEGLLKTMQIAAAFAAVIISIAFLLLSSQVNVDGIGVIRKMYYAIAPTQLFFISILALAFMSYVPLEDRYLSRLEWLGNFSACAVMMLGAAIFGAWGELNIHGEILDDTTLMGIYGTAIMVLGLVELVIFSRRREGVSETVVKISDWLSIPISLVIGGMGLMMLVLTTSITLDGNTYGVEWMLIWGMLLSVLGATLNYCNGVVAQKGGWHMDIVLVTTIVLLVMTPIAAML